MSTPLSAAEIRTIRADFPILSRTVRENKSLVYLDSGATSQRPLSVLDRERDFLLTSNAAVHRGAHQLAEEATDAFENARAAVAEFLGAAPREVVFTRSATESLNLLAFALGDERAGSLAIGAGDEIVVSVLEHHANLLPWQELARRTGATLRLWELTADGRIDHDSLELGPRTKLVSVAHVSNVTGAVVDVATLVARARAVGALVCLDACQSLPHMPLDVAALDVDFLAASGHKMCGPNGIGVLYGTYALLEQLPPVQVGGSMIETVTREGATYMPPPTRFEPGVPMMSQAVGLHAAVDYLTGIGMDRIHATEQQLTGYALEQLQRIDGLRIVGPTDTTNRGGAVSFTVEGIHPHDLGQVLDDDGVAIRVGKHCAFPAHDALGVQSTARASLYFYNLPEEIDTLCTSIRRAQEFFSRGLVL